MAAIFFHFFGGEFGLWTYPARERLIDGRPKTCSSGLWLFLCQFVLVICSLFPDRWFKYSLIIMRSQDWWFGDPRTLLYNVLWVFLSLHPIWDFPYFGSCKKLLYNSAIYFRYGDCIQPTNCYLRLATCVTNKKSKCFSPASFCLLTHRIHVWYIYPHLADL